MRPQPLLAVTDVEASSRWYQRLLGCKSDHGGPEYERLVANGVLILQLHRFEVEHHHGAIGDPADKPYGNGVLLWFEIDDFDAALARATELNAEIVLPRHRNPPDGDDQMTSFPFKPENSLKIAGVAVRNDHWICRSRGRAVEFSGKADRSLLRFDEPSSDCSAGLLIHSGSKTSTIRDRDYQRCAGHHCC